MNKLFSKIAALSVGLAMAVGVGAALGHEGVREVRAAASDTYHEVELAADKEVLIVGKNSTGYFAMGSAGGTSSAPSAISVTVSDGVLSSSTDLADHIWVVSGSSSGWTFTKTGSSSVLYCTNTNNGVRVGSNSNSSFTISKEGYLKNSATSRYVGIYNSSDWRCYTSINNNIKDQTFSFWEVDSSSLEKLTIKNASGQTGPFNNLSSKFVGGYMFYSFDESSVQKAAAFTIGDSSIATVTDNGNGSCCVYPVKPGTVELTATLENYKSASASLTFVFPYEHAGTEADPFTVEEGIAKCQEIGTTASGDWYVKGIISAITSTAADATKYGNATFNLSDDGRNENYLIAFQVKYIGGVAFTEATFAELKVGYTAVVHGALVNYKGNTPEFNGKGSSSMVSLTPPETGDVDVVFEPETSLEIGDTGTFTATSNTAGVVFTWSVDKPEILSVDASTGEYEALELGTVRVTVTATAGDKEGSTHADIIVNGSSYMPVSEAVALAATVESGKTTDYYIYVEGYVKEFATSKDKSDNPRAFDIQTEDEESSIMVYTNVNPYADFIEGLALGTAIRVKAQVQNYNGKYELLNPVKISSEYVALTFAYELLSLTDAVCEGYDGVTDNHDAIASIWETLSPKYSGLNDAQKGRLVNPTIYGMGDTVKNAMARYDYLTGKYDLTNFITGRTPVQSNYTPSITFGSNNNSYIIIIVISAVSVMSFGLALFLRKKRSK